MRFRIRLSALAIADIRETVGYIRAQSGLRPATDWRRRLLETIRTLDEMPLRHALVTEEGATGIGARQLLHESHRIVYRVQDDEVEISRIYHVRRDQLRPEDLP